MITTCGPMRIFLPGHRFILGFPYNGHPCRLYMKCPEMIYPGRDCRTLRVKITKEIAEAVMAMNVEDVIPPSTDFDLRIEVHSCIMNTWLEVNGPASQPEPQPFVPQGENPSISPGAPLVAIRRLQPPVEEVFAEKSCNESQVALPLELNRMAWMMSESQQDRVPLESQTQPPLSESQRGMYLQHYSQLPLGQQSENQYVSGSTSATSSVRSKQKIVSGSTSAPLRHDVPHRGRSRRRTTQ